MNKQSIKFSGVDSIDIYAYKWIPPDIDKLKGIIQIAHGKGEHSGRYETFAETLASFGYAVYANDHRGHGKTGVSAGVMGYFADDNGWSKVVDDMHQLTLIIKEDYPSLPVYLLGHSMGSLLARTYICKYGNEIDGVILSGTNHTSGIMLRLGLLLAKFERCRRGKKGKSCLFERIITGGFNNQFKPTRTDRDWLSSVPEEVDIAVADPLCGGIFTAGFFHDMISGMIELNKVSNIAKIPKDLHIHLFSGDSDPVSHNGKSVLKAAQIYKKAGISEVTYRLYIGGRHEMLHESNKEEVFDDILNKITQWGKH
ncbi:lysophospholipase [bacterium]|nr:lysophospholipase [bacterium]